MAATGGTTLGTYPELPAYNLDELQALTWEAHKFKRLVAAHAHATEGIINSLEAGIDMIIHCTFREADGSARYREDVAARIAEAGAWVNPTLYQVTGAGPRLDLAEKEGDTGLTDEEQERYDGLKRQCEDRLINMRKMAEAGVKFVTGTDCGWGPMPFDRIFSEMDLMVQGGLSTRQAVLSACRDAADSLGLLDTIGTLEPGKEADVAVFGGKPYEGCERHRQRGGCIQGWQQGHITLDIGIKSSCKERSMPNLDIVIANSTVITPAGAQQLDIGITDGRISVLASPGSAPEAARTIDGTGRYALPGCVDCHVHTRDPGQTHKEDFNTLTRAARAGGVTTIMCQPTTTPAINSADMVHQVAEDWPKKAMVDFTIQAMAEPGNMGEIPGMLEAGAVSMEFLGQGSTGPMMMDIMKAVHENGGISSMTASDGGHSQFMRQQLQESGRVDIRDWLEALAAGERVRGCGKGAAPYGEYALQVPLPHDNDQTLPGSNQGSQRETPGELHCRDQPQVPAADGGGPCSHGSLRHGTTQVQDPRRQRCRLGRPSRRLHRHGGHGPCSPCPRREGGGVPRHLEGPDGRARSGNLAALDADPGSTQAGCLSLTSPR